jgi:hypothetical protein
MNEILPKRNKAFCVLQHDEKMIVIGTLELDM